MATISINMDSLREKREWTRFKIIENGDNIYRILPPFGDVEVHNNYPYKYWSVCFMIDPSRGKRVPFCSPRTFNEPCPMSEYMDDLKKRIEQAQKALEARGNSKESIKEALKVPREIAYSLNVSGSYMYNACNKSGNIGILELKSTAHKILKKKMSEYIKNASQDPTSMNSEEDDSGVWFKFSRQGTGMMTEYGCDINMMTSRNGGKIVQTYDQDPLPAYVIENYQERGYDIYNLYKKYSYEELMDILMFNLSTLVETCPFALFGRWNPAAYFEARGASMPEVAPKVVVDIPEEPVDVPEVVLPKASRKPVTLKLDEPELDIESVDLDIPSAPPPPVASKPAAAKPAQASKPPVAAKIDLENDDLFAFAEGILQDL